MHSKKIIKCTLKRIDALKMGEIWRYWTCFSATRVLAPGASGNDMCVADTSGGMPWMFAWFYGDSGMDKATDTTMVLLQQPDVASVLRRASVAKPLRVSAPRQARYGSARSLCLIRFQKYHDQIYAAQRTCHHVPMWISSSMTLTYLIHIKRRL